EDKNISVVLKDNNGIEDKYELIIKGWIGAYKTTKGRKTEVLEFQDNFISLYSNGKMGEFNILPRIGQNKLPEVYVVGQLHVDLFEETTLPDMALSNRQGYKDDDIRYIKATEFARELLNDIINLRTKWSIIKKKSDSKKEIDMYKNRESLFKENILSYQDNVSYDVAKALSLEKSLGHSDITLVEDLVKKSLEKHKKLLGLKTLVDRDKKKILISQTSRDKDLSDVIYEMLFFNGISKSEMIFTNSDDEVSRIPEGYDIYQYLRDFFVESISDQKMYVIYVTSVDMAKSWGAIVEVGANWITQMNHKIFNINDFSPGIPLNIKTEWHQSYRNIDNNIEMNHVNLDKFCVKIESICLDLGYHPKSRKENIEKLKELVIEL
ncbi:MAG: ATP-binding protein, partial [bacterium]|nr:ATP-binding protein [bacterium]